MYLSLNKILPMLFILVSTMITITSSSWIMAWIGLEVNLLAFIPLMITNNKLSNESALKYFFVQAVGSILIFLSTILLLKSLFMNSMDTQNFFIMSLIPIALILKLGAAPFHFWFPSLMEGLNWLATNFLLTWQKIAPLFLMSTYSLHKSLLYLSIIASIMVGSLGGLNQMFLRKLMAYSSINHIGWMLTATILSINITISYFMIYSLITITIILMLMNNNTIHLSQLLFNYYMPSIFSVLLFMNFLSLGGMPPFLGFFPKWILLSTTMSNSMFMLSLALVMCSILTLYFYLRVSFNLLMMNPKLLWYNKMLTKPSWTMKFIGSVPIILLPMVILT